MDPIQKTTALIFAVTIVLIITRKFSTVGFSLLGVIAMVVAGSMTDVEAFKFVDVHLLIILVSIWIIAGYFGKTPGGTSPCSSPSSASSRDSSRCSSTMWWSC
jgi:hypothetical protein